MASIAVSRPPDILIRTAPALSATADAPLEALPKPPVSASNDAGDQDAGVPAEMSLEEKAAADPALKSADATGTASEATEAPPAKPGNPAKAKPDSDAKSAEATDTADDGEPDLSDLPPSTPKWALREVSIARKALRTQTAQADAAVKSATETAAAAQAELADIRAKLAAVPTETPQSDAKADPRPTRDRFDDPDTYDSALTEWAQREGERKAEAKIAAEAAAARAANESAAQAAQKAANEAELSRLKSAWDSKREAAIAKYEDYVAVADGDHAVSVPMAHAIMLADNGPDIAYHLGKNPEESARIAALPNIGLQLLEIGKLAATLSTPARAPRNARSRPIEPIERGNAPADTSDREPSMDEWAAKRNAEIRNGRTPFFMAAERAAARH